MKKMKIEGKNSNFFDFFSMKKQPSMVVYEKGIKNIKKIQKNHRETPVLECLTFYNKAPIMRSL